MSIREVDVSNYPVCPQCMQRDKVVWVRTGEQPTHPSENLVNWYCDRCHGRLSALPPLLLGQSGDRVNAILGKPKRRRREEQSGE